MSTAEIAAALAAFQAEMPTVPKSRRATVPMKAGGQYSYTYAGLAEVTDAAMPLMQKHGLSFTACPRSGERGFELVGILLHTSGESLEGSLPLYGNSAQEIGSSLTYNRRYLLGCMTGLVTDDDDDGHAAQQTQRRTETPMTARSRGEMFALFSAKGIADAEAQLAGINQITGGGYTSRGDLSEDHALQVIAVLRSRPDAAPADPMLTAKSPRAVEMHSALATAGITERDGILRYASDVLKREVTSPAEMTEADAVAVIAAVKADLESPFPTEEPS